MWSVTHKKAIRHKRKSTHQNNIARYKEQIHNMKDSTQTNKLIVFFLSKNKS